MALDSLENNRLNINNLVLYEPARKIFPPFDPDRDLDLSNDYRLQTFKNNWYQKFDAESSPGIVGTSLEKFTWDTFIKFARNISILFPESVSLEDKRERIKEVIAGTRDANSPDMTLQLASSLKIAFGISNEEMGINEDYDELQKQVRPIQSGNPNVRDIINLANLVILFPEKRNELNTSDDAWKACHNELVNLQDSIIQSNRFVHFVAALRILFPHKKTEIWENDKLWDKLKENLHNANREDVYTEIAANMKVIAADEVKITDIGLELIMPELTTLDSESTPPLPEEKKF